MGEASAGVRGSEPCILVVDDEPALRISIEAVLSDGFRVQTAANAVDAERVLRRHPVDVVLTDHQMPECSGTELIRRIHVATPSIVCILMTGHAYVPEVCAARTEQLAFHILIKPVNPDQLRLWVRTASQTARLRAAVQSLKRHLDPGPA